MLTKWKRTEELSFLNEVSAVALQQSLRHLHVAFANFFGKRPSYPRFKSRRRSRASPKYTKAGFSWRDGELTLAKMDRPLAIRWSRPLPEGSAPETVTVSRDQAGRWFISLVVETSTPPHPVIHAAVGVDVGLSSLVTMSTGEKVSNPLHEVRERSKLTRAQRRLAKKTKGSANRDKARREVARIHARIADRRRDFLHKLSTRLVRENQTIVIEDLNVSGMLRNGKLARAMSDAAWSDFRAFLEYKAQWYGRTVIAVDRWFPSSKICSACGQKAESMPLNVRDWRCDGCGAAHDRDVNAAKNVLAAGLAVAACGGDVRPTRRQPARRLPAKQEARPVRVVASRLHARR
ncbi:transposase [Lentzea cavernae]|uniref:Transposase n=2 Tax=Lentzea cavernae TaxID=2020703 RepID=A0ABQ3MKT1_9PSEU|nr:transposase [Lentzea cavernae]